MANAGRRSQRRPVSPGLRSLSSSGRQTPNNSFDDGGEDSPPIPNVNERLGHLRPSRELLEYYRKKIAEYDDEHEEMTRKLDQYRMTYEEQHKIHWEMRQREEEIAELQKALSDMQVYLFQEREHVLRLYSENDRLKIRELEDRKRIQQLLALNGVHDKEVSYFFKEPPAKPVIHQKVPKRAGQATTTGVQPKNVRFGSQKPSGQVRDQPRLSPLPEEKYQRDNETLSLQVEALQAQLEEQTRLAKEHIDALLEDRRVKIEENETTRLRDKDKILTLTEKLHKTQELLYDSTKDFLELRNEGRNHERDWMAEKDRLLRELDMCKQELNISKDKVLIDVSETAETRQRLGVEVEALHNELQQAQKLSDMYREQVIQLEDELSRIREEGDVSKDIFKDRTDKMTKRLQLMNQRYQDLERRRNLEVEGFKNDIKTLRTKLKEMERQLYKVTIGYGENLEEKRPEELDMAILRNVRRTAGRSKKMMGDLKHLKSKVYNLENDLRHL